MFASVQAGHCDDPGVVTPGWFRFLLQLFFETNAADIVSGKKKMERIFRFIRNS